MARYKLPAYPRSEREARARVNRKLKALQRRAFDLLTDSAGMFEEGPVSSSIDRLFEDIDRGINSIKETMDEEVDRADERKLEENA